jgi:hypothetical protein
MMYLRLIKSLLLFSIGLLYPQKQMPMNDCTCFTVKEPVSSKHYYHPNYAYSVASQHPNVISVSNGKVSRVIKNNDSYTVIIKKGDLFFVYSGMAYVDEKVFVDSMIDRNNVIGKGILLNNHYTIEIQIYKGIDLLPDVRKYIKCKYLKN